MTELATYTDPTIEYGLTINQIAFAELVLANPAWSRTECYMQSYEQCKSRGTARVNSCHLFRNQKLQRYLEDRRVELGAEANIGTAQVLQEMVRIAFSNMQDYADWDAKELTIKDSKTLPRSMAAAISEISRTETRNGTTVKVKLHDKKGALDTIAKILGMVKDKQEVAIPGLDQLMSAIAANADTSNTLAQINSRYAKEREIEGEVSVLDAEDAIYTEVKDPDDT